MADIKWALSSDQQIPYQDDKALKLWFKVIKWFKPHAVDYLGDTSDQFCFSRFQEGTTKEFMKSLPKETAPEDMFKYVAHEEKEVADFYAKTRRMLPNAEMFSALGNHDIRVFNYADKHMPEILKDLTPESLWGLDNLGIDYMYYDELPRKRFGEIYVHHGISAVAEAGASVKTDIGNLGVSLIRGHCFSADTEILTKNGWKAYTEISVGDTVYTMNRDSGLGEWQNITDKFVYDGFDKMVSIKTQASDILVTPGHGMLVSDKKDGVYKECDAKDLLNLSKHEKKHLPLAALDESQGVECSDDEIRMLAWVIAEGNFDPYGEDQYRVRISQSDAPDGRLKRLEELFSRLGFKWNPIVRYEANTKAHGTWRNFNAYRITVVKKDFDTIKKYVDRDKTLGPDLMRMNGHQARVFLEEYVWADGCKQTQRSSQIATNNTKIKDSMQELAARAGYRSTVCRGKPKKEAPSAERIWYITFNTRDTVSIRKESVSEVDYEGQVWCVTVPNHTLMVRRNGKVFITMNSHKLGAYYKTYELRNETLRGYEIGHMCQVDSDGFKYSQIHNWQQGFALGWVHGEQVHIDLIEIMPDYTCVAAGKHFSL